MQYQLSHVVAGPILRGFGRPKVTGLENIPASGPALLASNHLSIIDSVYLPLMLSRPVVFPAKAEYFSAKGPVGRLWAAYLRSTNQLAMNRDDTRSATATLEAAADILRAGELFGFYPEGTRSPDGRLYKGKTGVARLALESRAPVVPCAMIGTFEFLPPGSLRPQPKIKPGVIFGPPMEFSRYYGKETDRTALRAVTDEIIAEIAKLSGQEYVPIYAADAKAQLQTDKAANGDSSGTRELPEAELLVSFPATLSGDSLQVR